MASPGSTATPLASPVVVVVVVVGVRGVGDCPGTDGAKVLVARVVLDIEEDLDASLEEHLSRIFDLTQMEKDSSEFDRAAVRGQESETALPKFNAPGDLVALVLGRQSELLLLAGSDLRFFFKLDCQLLLF